MAVGESRKASETYLNVQDISPSLDSPLPEPQGPVEQMDIGSGSLSAARRFVESRAGSLGLSAAKVEDLKLTITELAANSLVHGGESGLLRMWSEGDEVVVEVADSGVFNQPLVGRKTPDATQEGGRGMWIVNQLCDLVQMRTHPGGSVIRVRVSSA